jgi:hypothetical protein
VLTDAELEALAKAVDTDFAQWVESLTPGEKAELRYYQGFGYDRINPALRSLQRATTDPEALRKIDIAIEKIDSAISKGATARDLTVYRGVADSSLTLGSPIDSIALGSTFRDPAYLSTSLSPRAALVKAGTRPAPAVMQIDVPSGTPAAWFGTLGKKTYRAEYELLLSRESTIEVLDLGTCESLPMLHVRFCK